MRRLTELCLPLLVVGFGCALAGGGPPAGMSPLSILEARTVIGGAPTGDSCQDGTETTVEAMPGTGCDDTCIRIPNAFTSGSVGAQSVEEFDCANGCGKYTVSTQVCGS